jgi:2-iminobutanoate/2-iminopropanoate deaminase
MPKVIETRNAPVALGPYSQAIRAGNLLFASGQLPLDPGSGSMVSGSIENQTRRALDNVKSVLEAAGSGLHDVVKTTIFIRNMDDFSRINAAYAEYFPASPPARSCVEVARLPKDAQVEIEVIAYIKN